MNAQVYWYVFRYARYTKALSDMILGVKERDGLEAFIPMAPARERRDVNGKKIVVHSHPMISTYMFVRTSADRVKTVAEKMNVSLWTQLVTDYRDGSVTREPVTVNDREMRLFMKACECKADDISIVEMKAADYVKDDVVRVIKGPMKGMVGRLKCTPCSNTGLVVVPMTGAQGQGLMTQDSESERRATLGMTLAFSITVKVDEVEVVEYANNDHVYNQMKRIRPVIADALAGYADGGVLAKKVESKLSSYADRFGNTELKTAIQRDNLWLNLYRIYTVLDRPTEREAVLEKINTIALPAVKRRAEEASKRQQKTKKDQYEEYLTALSEADKAREQRKTVSF